jgi:PAS domain S-box-containing protein
MEDITTLKTKIKELEAKVSKLESKEYYDTTLLEADKKYQESQVRFRTVFEASRLGNKIINSELEILQVNEALVKLLGLSSKDEMIGKKILDFSPPDKHSDWQFLQEKLWRNATPSFCLETNLQRKDGTVLWCQVTSILFPDNGETLGYTIIEDITEQYKLRQQKEEFISVASHELKTPLTSLQATIQIMNRQIEEDQSVPDSLKKLAGNAERHTKKLNALVGDLLSSTKIEQGQLALNKHIFKLENAISGCCSHIQFNGNHRIKYAGYHSLEVFADQNKIDQVLVNLINNAVKYAPDSEEVVVQVEKINNGAKISVIDRGPGIPKDSLDKLFDRYFRVDEQKKQVSGLGLGLYISSEIIKRHGG